MAKLRIPEACSACGVSFKAGDKIEFTRRATLDYTWPGTRRVTYRLEPFVEPVSPRNVRHLVCPT